MDIAQSLESEQQAAAPRPVDYRSTSAPPQRSIKRIFVSIVVLLASIAFAADAFVLGVALRKHTYLSGAHYYGDVYNALRYGKLAVKYPPLLDFPETITKGVPEYRQGKFDYPPLRMTVSYLWAQWVSDKFPQVSAWPDGNNYHLVEPLLNLNTAIELVSALFIFMLIRMWKIRADDAQRPPGVAAAPFRGVVAGMMGALIFWFNPSVLANGHDWPQWDVWFFPFVLGAMLLASTECWIGVGMILAIGACFKGQVLLSLPFFVLWPLFRLNWQALVQLAGGFAIAFAGVALPFMRPTDAAVRWICLSAGALALMSPLIFRLRIHFLFLISLALIAAAVAYPWQSDASTSKKLLPVAILGIAGLAQFVPRRVTPGIFALCLGLSGFLVIPLFQGKTYWYDVSFDYGSRKFMTMAVTGTHNLPSILCRYFGWGGPGDGSPLLTHWVPFLGDVVIRKFLQGLQLFCVALCAIGAARFSRKPDTRMLLAMVTPMLCAFVILPQLNDRYIVWAAGLSALLAGVNVGLTLIGMIISWVGWIGMNQLMYGHAREGGYSTGTLEAWLPQLTAMQTHLGWILILAALVYLYMIFSPARRRPISA